METRAPQAVPPTLPAPRKAWRNPAALPLARPPAAADLPWLQP